MIRNYLKIGWRSLFKNKLFSFINIFGLALSLSICMMVMMRMKDAFSYDKFHPHPERTFRLISEINNKRGDHWKIASTPLPLKQEILRQNSGFEKIVVIYPAAYGKASPNNKDLNISGAFTDPSFFDVFGFTLMKGNPSTALVKPNSIVLNQTTAERFFGKKQALGKFVDLGNLGLFEVTGVLNAIPGKSHIDYDAYVSSSSIPRLEKENKLPKMLENWDSFEKGYTYILLKDESSITTLHQILKGISADVNKLSKDAQFNFITESLSAITPGNSDVYNRIGKGTSWMKVYIEGGVALIMLLAACFNYTNLTIAKALTRAREVGIRKVAGATRYQIFTQYIIEALLLALFAFFVAYIILMFIIRLKPFNDGYEMIPDIGMDATILIIYLAFTSFTGILAGSLPAWILSSFKPATVLKNISTLKLFGNISLQRILIVFQFSLSLVIIIFLSAFYRQFAFLGKADYGFRKDDILTIQLNGTNSGALINELASITGVEKISAISDNFGSRQTGKISVLHNKDQNLHLNLDYYFVDPNIVPVMDLKLMAGENLPLTNSENKFKYLLINEKAVAAMGLKSNDDAIGKTLWLNDTSQATVTGVIRDFYYRNPGIHIQPMGLINNPFDTKSLVLSVSTKNRTKLVNEIKSAWENVSRQQFNYSWFDKYLEEQSDQSATISLLGFLAFTAVFIGSLGLLGLVIYTVETRRKEVSIRKILGGSVHQLINTLSRGFIKLLVISGAIAMPLGFLLSKIFLQNFAIRTEFGIGSVVLCFLFLLGIGLFTILTQTWKVSSESPVKNLRIE